MNKRAQIQNCSKRIHTQNLLTETPMLHQLCHGTPSGPVMLWSLTQCLVSGDAAVDVRVLTTRPRLLLLLTDDRLPLVAVGGEDGAAVWLSLGWRTALLSAGNNTNELL